MSTVLSRPKELDRQPGARPASPACAVVWINGREAIVAREDPDGRIDTRWIERRLDPASDFLAVIIRAIGDRERLVIMGPSSVRLALERAYVDVYPRSDRLVDVEPSGPMSEVGLVSRLRELAG
jgi:hypothetical protein